MKPYLMILTTVLLAGCMSKLEEPKDESGEENKQSIEIMEEESLSEKQKLLMKEIPEVTSETALNNISEMFKYQHLAEKELKGEIPVPNTTDKEGVVNYLAFGLSQFMKGNFSAKEFFEKYSPFLDESYLNQFGDTQEIRIKTMQTVYDNYYKGIPVTKITKVFVSKTIVSKTSTDVIVAYRRHITEDGNNIFYEMGFRKNEKNEWLLVDNRISINPYDDKYSNTDETAEVPNKAAEGER